MCFPHLRSPAKAGHFLSSASGSEVALFDRDFAPFNEVSLTEALPFPVAAADTSLSLTDAEDLRTIRGTEGLLESNSQLQFQ